MVRRRRTSRKKKRSGAAGILLGIFLIAVLAAAAAWFLFFPSGPSEETFVEIAPGSSSSQIAAQLERVGIIRSRYAFALIRLWKRGILKAGEYRFDHAATVEQVYTRIAHGDVYTLAVTIPEGSNRYEVAARVAKAGYIHVTREGFLAAIESQTPLIASIDPRATSLEGYLFPDTYRFPRTATAAQIASAMVRRFLAVAGQNGLTQAATAGRMHDVVTLASLVERETAVASERPLVASVFANRLAAGMPLMTDPAVIYGLEIEGKWRGALYASDLADAKKDTPYNTYRHLGLPPAPICNPGLPALRAALQPAATSYFYFVAAGADPQGKSRFATTLDEHNRNVASYRRAVKQAGGH